MQLWIIMELLQQQNNLNNEERAFCITTKLVQHCILNVNLQLKRTYCDTLGLVSILIGLFEYGAKTESQILIPPQWALGKL